MSRPSRPDRSSARRSPAARPTDGELLDAARAVFAERGYAQATMGLIAERADSTKPTLYAHFGDKAALFRATVTREVAALRDWVLTAYETASARPLEERVRLSVMAMFGYAGAHPDSFRLLFDSAVDEMSNERRALADTVTTHVLGRIHEHLLAHGRTPGPGADLLAAMMVGLVGRAAMHVSHSPGVDPIAAGELATGFVLAALRGLDPVLLDRVDDARQCAT
ncbi:TetR/AcrR family transcriptional regulator [Amycolatopsis sp. FBCC-B4732]|uniref:TetR/AcrR family transcriptional regulator n=1 Tax=Amycolatopsis sp. FBCC-B4732 TaxID=3079339 RepID=UPI001FF6031E|nr:TetR/AcrR family transcriptional regulator [Amycolatopsis sp. FBCC-B4732]UOX92535.1 TetR/AcrR family transcriptional regulator [Amycolatopsis sp. FBCC-B4732]